MLIDSTLKKDPWYVIRIPEGKIVDCIYAFFFAILPIVEPIKSFLPVTWSMAILIISVPYIALKLINVRKIVISHSWPIWLYCGYRIINHGTVASELLTMLFVIALYIALINRLLDVETFFKVVIFVSLLASIFIFLQTILHYIFAFHLKLLPPSLLRTAEMREDYWYLLTTGISDNLYRPSAFFNEPAAVTHYTLPALFYLLIDRNDNSSNIRKAIVISIGIILSTSGMGIAFVVALWGYFFYKNLIKNGLLNVKLFFAVVLMVIVLVTLVMYVPFFNSAITRIFIKTGQSNSAIDGRFVSGQNYYDALNITEKIIGTGKQFDSYELYAAGMHYTILVDGIIGYVLYCLVYINLAIYVRNRYIVFILIVLALSIVSNIVFIQYYVYFLIAMGMGIIRRYESNSKMCNSKSS